LSGLVSGNVSARSDYDVAIVGFGPVGATLAGLLGKAGLRVCVIERETDVFRLPRAAHIDHMGLRAMQELGALDEVLPEMIPNPGLDFVSASRELLMQIPASPTSVSGLPASAYFFQPDFDRAVREAALANPGVEARLETLYLDHSQDADEVTITVRNLADGTDSELTADWLIGADGGPSPVREDADLKLENLKFDEMWLVLDLHLEDGVIDRLPDHAVHVCDPARPHTAIPMPGDRYRFELMLLPGEMPAEMERPKTVDRLLSGWLEPGMAKVERAAVYTFHGLVAEKWRNGRVLIAGDAAHQMPPFLGQGMCSGLRDAVNLAWKLKWVCTGVAPAALLDTYETERRPHVRAIIEAVIDFGDVICTLDQATAAKRDSRLLADPRPPARRLPFALPQLEPGPLVREGGGGLFVQPSGPVRGGQCLDDLVGGRFLVIGSEASRLDQLRDRWAEDDGIVILSAGELTDGDQSLKRWLERHAAEVAIVRPDRYALWAGSTTDADEVLQQIRNLVALGPNDRP
jgi:3-(3-hydroxy-phenyl)propionate hydroxylase